MFEPRIKIPRTTFEKLGEMAEKAGYSTTEEFVLHILDKTIAEVPTDESEEEVRKRLQGLGYLE